MGARPSAVAVDFLPGGFCLSAEAAVLVLPGLRQAIFGIAMSQDITRRRVV
jgi:hypothetical protein